MNSLYPETEPYDHGMLAVGDGNEIHWESCGNPQGIPVLVLHGGPGSGSSASARRFFDPGRYRVILFDQRGCGLSTPHASDPQTDMSVNTTAHLLRDIECLRKHLDVTNWLLFGISWGCTLGLAYAETHPGRVLALVVAGVTTTRRSEIDWLYRDIAPLFPVQWECFRRGAEQDSQRHISGAWFDKLTMRGIAVLQKQDLPHGELVEPRTQSMQAEFAKTTHEPDDDLIASYHYLLNDADPVIRLKAARDWHAWEAASILVGPKAALSPKWSDDRFILARARIITHYFHHNAWLEDRRLLNNANRLKGIPGVMVQGRFDLEAPLVTAWELSKVWPDGELVIVPNAGHSPGSPGMTDAIVSATDRLARTLGS
ncbi:alpha/beta fold hydrolase [Phyllobacterium myrsinacearum]|nr:alpha/beta fold hydrolase [Phyllobacterium myrsinacearum]